MTIKTILAPIAGRDEDTLALDAAFEVARRFGAHIEVLHVAGDPRDAVPFLGEGASGALIEQIMAAASRESGTRAERAKKTFESWRAAANLPVVDRPASGAGPSTTWRQESGPEDEWIGRRGRVADIVVIARPADPNALAWTVAFEAALLESGHPVLVMPPGSRAQQLSQGPVVIAWKPSAQSARAVAAAKPFLAGAKRVVAVTIAEGPAAAADTQELITFLAWHGIAAEGRTPELKSTSVGAVILSEAEALGAGLVIMGAYHHNRLRQMIFGGVTRHVTAHAKLPVLLAR